ncbi:MAG: glycosyltransferase [Anaerolineae bacterium]|nr:glycosyltransferase [Anaerolineae bacterium]
MHILHLVHQYMPEYVGGVELYTRWLAHIQVQEGHQVSIFYRRSGEGTGVEPRNEDGVRVWGAWDGPVTPMRRFRVIFGDPALVTSFEQVLDETQPEIVHVEHLMGHPTTLINVLQRRHIPFVVMLHDFWWRCANAQLLTNYDQTVCPGPQVHYLNCARCALARAGKPGLGILAPLFAPLMAWRNHRLSRVLRAASVLIVPTVFVEQWYATHAFPRSALRVLPLGLEHPVTLPSRRRESDNSVRFLYMGGLSFQKGIHTLIEAFAGVRGAAELWIAGDETFDPVYMAQLRSLATPQVRFLGRLARPEVWQALVDADVVVVPSLWYETFSFLVSEGFIAGKPVLASRLGPLADRVRDRVDGLLLPPGDVVAWREAMQRLVDVPDGLAQMRQNVCPPLSLEEHEAVLAALYARAIDGYRVM